MSTNLDKINFNSLLPFHHVSFKVVLPSGKARHKGSVRLLHGDKDGVSAVSYTHLL